MENVGHKRHRLSRPTPRRGASTRLTLRGSLQTVWAGARSAYLTLKKVRADLGYSFIAPPMGEGGIPDNGAWTDSLEGNILDLQAMVKVTDDAFGDVLAQKRKLLVDVANNDYGVEGLPTDLVRVRMNQAGQLRSWMPEPNHPVGGTIDSPDHCGRRRGRGRVVGAVTFVAAALIIKKTCDTVATIAERRRCRPRLTKQPSWCRAVRPRRQKLLLSRGRVRRRRAARDSEGNAEAQKNQNSDVSNIPKTVTTVAFIGLGIGVIYL